MKGGLNAWLLLAVVVAALSVVFGRGLRRDVAPVAPAPGRVDAAESEPARPDLTVADEAIHVEVLNGTPAAGLAREFGLLLGPAGCVVEQVGNAPHGRHQRSFLVNRTLSRERVAALADRLGGLPVLQEHDGRTTADVVLVLGADVEAVKRALAGSDGP
ncbi:LytR C-terminal domain-containing protein [bacterium]|nr:LytR C-terminal domain-containing protein [bacterium]